MQSMQPVISNGQASNVTHLVYFCGGCRVVIAKYKNTVYLGTRVYPSSVFPLPVACPLRVCVRVCVYTYCFSAVYIYESPRDASPCCVSHDNG